MENETVKAVGAIDKAIKKYGWVLHSWEDRYGRGIWAMVSYSSYAQTIADITWGGDTESLELGFYLNEKGSWLPVANGNTVLDALLTLENKINLLIDDKTWRECADNAFERIEEVNDGNYGLKIAVDNDSEGVFSFPPLNKNIPTSEKNPTDKKILMVDEAHMLFQGHTLDDFSKRIRKQ